MDLTMNAVWALPARRPGSPAGEDLALRRDGLRALDALQIVDPAAQISECEIGGVRCIDVLGPGNRATLIHAHGGGFRMGQPETWTGFASRLAVAVGMRVILPDYSLAPEAPFPGGLSDLADVYRAVAADSNGPILLGGDSAGGGLATGLALAARDAGGVAPSGLVLFSPWLDLTITAASYSTCAESDQAFSRDAAIEAAAHYLAGIAADDPLASPLMADSVVGLPPAWICASGSEVLIDDTIAFIARLAAARIRVESVIEPDLPHVWPLISPGSSDTAETLASAARFIRRCLAD